MSKSTPERFRGTAADAVIEGFSRKRPKSAVSRVTVERRRRRAPTSTLLSPPFTAWRARSRPRTARRSRPGARTATAQAIPATWPRRCLRVRFGRLGGRRRPGLRGMGPQGHPHPRAPRSAHDQGPARRDGIADAGAGGRRLRQLVARASDAFVGRIRCPRPCLYSPRPHRTSRPHSTSDLILDQPCSPG